MNHAAPFSVRPMRPDDLPAVLAVQAITYASVMHESAATLASRLHLSPDTCQVAQVSEGKVAGYLFTHAWTVGLPPALDMPLADLPAQPDCWYIHDLALHPSLHGQGAARALYEAARQAASAWMLPHSALVAVQDAAPFWQRFGYVAEPAPSAQLRAKLRDYGDGAVYMMRALSPE